MEFTNAYDLVLHFYNQGQLKGIRYTGYLGEVILDTTLTDKNLMKLLESVWFDWSLNFDNTAKSVGNYTLEYSEADGLFVEGYCEDEYPNRNEFDIDEILHSIIKYLQLVNIDNDKDLAEQLDLMIEMNNWGEIETFEIDSPDYDELNEEILEKLNESVRDKLTVHLQELLNSMHSKLNPDTDFNIYIESSHLYNYSIFWEEKFTGLKDTLSTITINYNLLNNK